MRSEPPPGPQQSARRATLSTPGEDGRLLRSRLRGGRLLLALSTQPGERARRGGCLRQHRWSSGRGAEPARALNFAQARSNLLSGRSNTRSRHPPSCYNMAAHVSITRAPAVPARHTRARNARGSWLWDARGPPLQPSPSQPDPGTALHGRPIFFAASTRVACNPTQSQCLARRTPPAQGLERVAGLRRRSLHDDGTYEEFAPRQPRPLAQLGLLRRLLLDGWSRFEQSFSKAV